jgi:4-coumarate--CoA ligase
MRRFGFWGHFKCYVTSKYQFSKFSMCQTLRLPPNQPTKLLNISKPFQGQFLSSFSSSFGFGIDASKLCSVILCSSGTTGLSKGTMLSSTQLFGMMQPLPKLSHPVQFSFSSLYWLSGLGVLLYSLANCSKRVITKRKFSPLVMVHLIERYKVNVCISPPSHIALLVQSPVLKIADLSSIRVHIVGGGFLPANLRQAMQDHLFYGALVVSYGMTELAGIAAVTQPFQPVSNSVGKISPNMKMKVVDEDGNVLEPNEVGEIHILSPVKFLGYANNPEASRNAFDSEGLLKKILK